MTWSPVRRARRFADRLVRRHALVRAFPRALARVIARRAGGWQRRPQRAVRVTAVLEMVVRAEGRRALAGKTIGPSAGPAAPPRAAVPVRRSVSGAGVERLLARRERVERAEATPSARPTHRPSHREAASAEAPVAPPVPRVLRQERRQTPVAEARERDAAPVRTTWRATPTANADLLTPAQVDRVAEQVLHTIDRRLLAHRERRGRS
jgi:hypothetical protein